MPEELHVQFGECADLIERKLRDYQSTMDQRMAALMADLERLREHVDAIEDDVVSDVRSLTARVKDAENLVNHIR